MERIIIVGCGGHAKSLVDIIERQGLYKIVGFIEPKMNKHFEYRGYKIIATDAEFEHLFSDGIKYAAIGIGYLGKENVRKKIYQTLKTIGFSFPIIIDPSAIIANDVSIGEGSMIGKAVVLNSQARIGKMTIINTSALIEHECIVGDFSHVAIGVNVCGNVTIEENSFIGAGSTIIQGKRIGKNCLVGAGSLVLSHIENNQTKMGIIK